MIRRSPTVARSRVRAVIAALHLAFRAAPVAGRVAASAAALVAAPAALVAQGAADSSAALHRVSGVAYDSLAFEPLVGALIAVRPANVTTTTDSAGRFSVQVAQPATELTVYHPTLDDIGLGALVANRPGNTGDWTDAQVATPSLLTLWPRLCESDAPRGARGAIVMGTARLPDQSTRLVGARVLVQWRPFLSAAGDETLETVEAVTDSIGNYIACGVEEYAEYSLLAQSQEAQSGIVRLPASARSIRRVDLILAEMGDMMPTTRLQGRIIDQDEQPLAGMRVAIDGRTGTAVSAADGRFVLDSVPYGSRMLSIRGIGFTQVAQLVEVVQGTLPELTIPMTKATVIEGVVVTERANLRRDRAEYELRRRTGRSRVVDSAQLRRAPYMRAALQMVPGLQVRPIRGASTQFALFGNNGCAAHVYIDGVIASNDEANQLPQDLVAAVEVFRSVAFAPAQFIRVMADDCAVVIFWTKYGLRP